MQRITAKPEPAGRNVIRRSVVLAVAAALMWVTAMPVAGASAATDRLEPFDTQVLVNDDPFTVASVHCDFLQRTQHPDGTSIEVQHCQIADLLIGEMPTTAWVSEIASCEWASDYWLNTTGEPLFADRGRSTVTPSGEVHVVTRYPADPDDLVDCGFA